MSYPVEPGDHWRAGDRAYCVRGLKNNGRHIVEKGRIYTVEAAMRLRAMIEDGLNLVGVDPKPAKGLWSNRFVCIRGQGLPIKQIEERSRRKAMDAYFASVEARKQAQGDAG